MNKQLDDKEANGKPELYTVLGNNVYLQILNRFKAKDDMRMWMSESFNVGEKTVSTNGYILVATPLQEGFDDKSNKTTGVYPVDIIMDKKISTIELKEKLKDFPKVDCFDEEEEKCDACEGFGEVDFVFSHGSKDYEIEEECPVCEGSGIINSLSKKPNGKKELDYNKFFGIAKSVFNLARVEELLEVAEILKSNEITLVNQTLFKIKDVEVLLMPTMCSDLSNVVSNVA